MELITVYENFLKESCKIYFRMIQGKHTKEMKWRDLTGPEKLRLFAKINIPEVFPAVPQSANVQKLWSNFLSMYKTLDQSTDKIPADSFETKATNWLRLFTTVYQTRHVTPYMHLLTSHIAEFLDIHGTIVLFSQQGLEKMNDDVTKFYFRVLITMTRHPSNKFF